MAKPASRTPAATPRIQAPRDYRQSFAATLQILATAVLLTLAGAPFGPWYLAWIALAPWLVAVGTAPSVPSALLRGWLGGLAYFAANIWWLWTASAPGTVLIILYLALYWALAAGLIRGFGLFSSRGGDSSVVLALPIIAVAVVWVAVEWLRCNLATGFPWLPMGVTQTSVVAMCQIADLGGPWIVSFWLALPNALAAMVLIERNSHRALPLAALVVTAVLLLVAGYGAWRLQTTATTTGPRVMVLQSNFAHLPGGARTVEDQEAVEFYLSTLEHSLAGHEVDLVILPEAAFPPINEEARRELARSPMGPFLEAAHERLLAIAREHQTTLLIGGNAVTGWITRGREHLGSEIRNSAYYYQPRADVAVARYDKIHLVGFSEQAPFASGPAWLRRLALTIAATRAAQPMHPGQLNELRPFVLPWAEGGKQSRSGEARFIAPICLENVDPRVLARMIRQSPDGEKRADFIANLSNDGWFATQEKHQHLQMCVLRTIEHRVPMARASNAGISGFIDSCGRVHDMVPAGSEGVAVRRLELDARSTFYTRNGDVFAAICLALVALALLKRTAVALRPLATRRRA